MGKRVRQTFEPVGDIAAVDEAMRELIQLRGERRKVEVTLNNRIAKAKEDAAERAKPIEERMASLEGGILNFVERERGTLFSEKKKSMDLRHGRIGTRKTSAVRLKRGEKWDLVCQALEEDGHVDAIKKTTKPVKTHLSGWPEEKLAEYGIIKKVDDPAWLELRDEALPPSE